MTSIFFNYFGVFNRGTDTLTPNQSINQLKMMRSQNLSIILNYSTGLLLKPKPQTQNLKMVPSDKKINVGIDYSSDT